MEFRKKSIVIVSTAPLTSAINYHPMTREQITTIFNLLLSEFYSEINAADSTDSKIRAITKLIQHLEWLHPPKDGCGRTDTALLNFLLTKYGFSPVLLDYPYLSSFRGLDEWKEYVIKGMGDWLAVALLKPKQNLF